MRPHLFPVPWPSGRVLLYVAAPALFALAFYQCGARKQRGEFTEQQRADSVTYAIQRAEFVERIAFAEVERDRAEAALDSSRSTNRAREASVTATATRRVVSVIPTGITQDSMTSVCLGDPPECYPAHAQVAKVAQELDSIVHQVVVAQMIPALEAERRQAIEVIGQYRNVLTIERQTREAAEFRVGQLELTVRTLQPTSGRRKLEQIKHVALFVAGVYVGARATRYMVSR